MTQIADIDHAIHALDGWLRDQDYTRRSRDGIAAHIREHGELSGTVPQFLDLADLEVATEVYCESLPPVPPESDEWSDDGRWTPNDTCRIEPPELEAGDGTEPEWEPDDFDWDAPDGTPDESVTRQPGYREALERDGITLMPISGGAPEPEPTPFVPSEADWAEYREWTEWVDRLDSLPDE
jgi:hypothetical protein